MDAFSRNEGKASVNCVDSDPPRTGWYWWNPELQNALTVRLLRGRLPYVILRSTTPFLRTRGLRNQPVLSHMEYIALVEFDHLYPAIMPYLQELWYKPVTEGGFEKKTDACAAFLNQPVAKIHNLIMHRESTFRSQPSLRVHQKPLLYRSDDILNRAQRLQLKVAGRLMDEQDTGRLGLAAMLLLLVAELFYQGEGHHFDSLLALPAHQLQEAVKAFRSQYIASKPKAADDGFAMRKNYNYCDSDIHWLMLARGFAYPFGYRWTHTEIMAMLKDVNTDHDKLGEAMLNRPRSPKDRLEACEVVPKLFHLLQSDAARLSFSKKFDRFFPTDNGMPEGFCNRCAQPIGQAAEAKQEARAFGGEYLLANRPMSDLEVTIFKAHRECLKSSWAGECARNRSLVPRKLSNGFPRIDLNEFKQGEILFALEDEGFISDRDDEGSDGHYDIYEDRLSQFPLRDWDPVPPADY
jgi:hypothetical protein